MFSPLRNSKRIALSVMYTEVLSLDYVFVGAGIFVFKGSRVRGVQPNNGLVITYNPSINGTRRFHFHCRSDSLTVGVGELIGLNGHPIIGGSFFGFPTPDNGGELRVESISGTHNLLTYSEQGVYTCRIPLGGDGERDINIGIYTNGFDSELAKLN